MGERRILLTRIVGTGWEWIHEKQGKMIRRPPQQAGQSPAIVNIIQGAPSMTITDWAQGGLDCNLNWQEKSESGKSIFLTRRCCGS